MMPDKPTRLIMDDPHMHHYSEEERERVLEWWREVCLNNPKLSFGESRLHEMDLTGFLLKDEKENWELLKLPIQKEE